ncbi:MAG: DUF4190 domain-containing protein [Actinomycetota bacterium]|nr:DUF4190 domain-containing protein [Actinomycetota bacterium]
MTNPADDRPPSDPYGPSGGSSALPPSGPGYGSSSGSGGSPGYGGPQGYGDPQGQPAAPGYGGAPGYGSPQGYGGPGYGDPGYGGGYERPKRNGFGIAALILGILALLTAFIPVLGLFLAIPFGLAALVLGFLGRRRAKRGEASNGGLALAGLVLGVLALVVSIGFTAFVLTRAEVRDAIDCVSQAQGDQAALERCQREAERRSR